MYLHYWVRLKRHINMKMCSRLVRHYFQCKSCTGSHGLKFFPKCFCLIWKHLHVCCLSSVEAVVSVCKIPSLRAAIQLFKRGAASQLEWCTSRLEVLEIPVFECSMMLTRSPLEVQGKVSQRLFLFSYSQVLTTLCKRPGSKSCVFDSSYLLDSAAP